MYFLITKRVVKVPGTQNAGDKFYARQVNRQSYTVSGPFQKTSAAERSMVRALGTHTCLSAEVLSAEKVKELVAKGSGSFDNEYWILLCQIRSRYLN